MFTPSLPVLKSFRRRVAHNPYSQVLKGHHLSICPALRADRVRKSGLTVDPVGLSIRNATRPGFPHRETHQKRKKNQKEKSLWKLPQLWKSTKEAFGNFFLMISTAAWKSLRKNRSGFPTVTTGPTATVTQTPTSTIRYVL
jgi:hypothetical protein